MGKALSVSVDGHIAQVTLTGPGRHNALGPDFWRELPEVFTALDRDPGIRAVILTGKGGNFSVGTDLEPMRGVFDAVLGAAPADGAAPRRELLHWIRGIQAATATVVDCRHPVIAAVHGVCIGGALDLIAAADLRYASADARFSLREVAYAMVADAGSLHRLPVVESQLREMAFTGALVDAAHAARIGLVNDVEPDRDALLVRAWRTAAEIATNPPLAVQGIKEVLNRRRAARSAVAGELDYAALWNVAFAPSADLAEGFAAALERRAPRFTGR
ncbi:MULTISPECIES: crotonase/enoyl-CoA hydratase family protein [unclassified Streptomyces]|uniref:crotonase/enoyl-CoA hydratase family protein n=1 Tax=unclassified Streptomyces TaxID=2593676 RepID=UPI0016613040|nr:MULTISPECIES: crotonase/enoyl-CoA hydratase family protein [unclassified Streptomyces]MBD0711209.1 enoyl-CoA hydratase [Streptomyces sp. CBMA291]MBD0714240.1 enoyl-CoA hydratase [Streptomyces sp. CBMA370]